MPVGSVVAFWGISLVLIIVPGADWAFTLGSGLRERSVIPAVGGLVLGYAAMTIVVAAGLGALVADNPRALSILTVIGGSYLMWHGLRTLSTPVAPASALAPSEPAPTPGDPASASSASNVEAPPLSSESTISAKPAPVPIPPTAPATPATPATRTTPATPATPGVTGQPGEVAADLARGGWATLTRGVGVSGLNPKGLMVFVALLPQFTSPTRAWPPAVQMSILGLVFTLTCAVFYLALGWATRTILRTRPAATRLASRGSGTGMIIIGALLIIDRLT